MTVIKQIKTKSLHLTSHQPDTRLRHLFNGPLFRTTRVGRYQKGKTNLDFTEARDSEWQWHQLGHMQVCTSLQTDNHASTPHSVFYRPDALPAAQPTASKHWRHVAPTTPAKFSFCDRKLLPTTSIGQYDLESVKVNQLTPPCQISPLPSAFSFKL